MSAPGDAGPAAIRPPRTSPTAAPQPPRTSPTAAGQPPRTSNDAVFALCEPFLVAPAANAAELDRAPFGLALADDALVDPLRLGSAPFLTLLERLDALSFGPEGMPMPRWVFFDCSELPGAIFGFGRRARALGPALREAFQVPAGYTGLVPLSMYIAIPMIRPGHWFGHNLSAATDLCARAEPGWPSLRGLGSFTKAVALRVFGTRRLFGATQWASKALRVHARFGPLELVTAYTPAHSEPRTLTYAFDAYEAALHGALGTPGTAIARPVPELFVDPADAAAMERLQDRLEAGERFVIPDAPRRDGHVPVARIP